MLAGSYQISVFGLAIVIVLNVGQKTPNRQIPNTARELNTQEPPATAHRVMSWLKENE